MFGIITGDIIHSRTHDNPDAWIGVLKTLFNEIAGESRVNWEIFRGDSFQLRVAPSNALRAALRIKAVLRSYGDLDARISIGIGAQSYAGGSISESSGEAYFFSGESLERLKKSKRDLVITTPWEAFDITMNLYLRFLQVVTDSWKQVSAETVAHVLAEPERSQKELAAVLDVSQPAVSARYSRAHTDEISELLDYFALNVDQLISAS